MDWIQWWAAALGTLIFFGRLFRVQDGEMNAADFFISMILFLVPFGRVFGWW